MNEKNSKWKVLVVAFVLVFSGFAAIMTTPTVLAQDPTVTTEAATDVGSIEATLNMEFDMDGAEEVTVYFRWSDDDWETSTRTTEFVYGIGNDSHEETLTHLDLGTTYEYYAVVEYDGEFADRGEIESFTTDTDEVITGEETTTYGDEETYMVHTLPGVDTYTWYLNDVMYHENSDTITVHWDETGTHTIEAIVQYDDGTHSSAELDVTVETAVEIDGPEEVVVGSEAVYEAIVGGPAVANYTWELDGVELAHGPENVTVEWIPEETGVYTLELTVEYEDEDLADDTADLEIEAITRAVIDGPEHVFVGSEVTYSASVEGPAVANYTWELDGVELAHGPENVTVEWIPEETGVYTLELTVEYEDEDLADDTADLDIEASLISGPQDVLYDDTVTYTAHNHTIVDEYEWTINGDPVGGDEETLEHTWLEVGEHEVGLTITYEDATTDSDTLSVTVNTTVAIDGLDWLCVGEEETYTADVTGPDVDSYTWYLDGADQGVDADNITIDWTDRGVYTLEVEVEYVEAIPDDTAELEVTVDSEIQILEPIDPEEEIYIGGHEYKFEADVCGPAVENYKWYLDGEFLEEGADNTTITFTEIKHYNIELTVIYEDGNWDRTSIDVFAYLDVRIKVAHEVIEEVDGENVTVEEPIEDAEVVIQYGDTRLTEHTDADGIASIPVSSYDFTLAASEYEFVEVYGIEYELTPEDTPDGIFEDTIILEEKDEFFVTIGPIVDYDEEEEEYYPVRDTVVTLSNETLEFTASTEVSAEGFGIIAVPVNPFKASFDLTVSHGSFQTYYSEVVNTNEYDEIVLEDRVNTFHVGPVVDDETGDPISRVRVNIQREGTDDRREGLTDENGEISFTFSEIENLTHTDDDGEYIHEFVIMFTEYEYTVHYDTYGGQGTGEVRLEPKDEFVVFIGPVVEEFDEEYYPLSGADVTLEHEHGDIETKTGETDADGEVIFFVEIDPREETFGLTVSLEGYQTVSRSFTGTESGRVVLSETPTEYYDVEVGPVRDHDDRFVSDAYVTIYHDDRDLGTEMTDDFGIATFEITVDPEGTEFDYTIRKDGFVEQQGNFIGDTSGEITIYGEAEFEVTGFDVDPVEEFVPFEANITADIENVGGSQGDISLYVAGDVLETWTLEAGETVSVDEFYEFEEVGEYDVELGEEIITVDAKQGYELTVNTFGEGTVYIVEDLDQYEEGTTVTLTATPADNWGFVGWMGTEETGEEITITMDDDKTITAVFEEDVVEVDTYTLTVETEGEGRVSISPDYDEYKEGTTVTLTANPADGWELAEWQGTDEEGETITITMDEDKEITAVFEEIPTYSLTVDTEGEGTVDIDPDQDEYEEGTTVTLTANPADGWEFAEWQGTDETGETITITIDDDMEITAVFEEEDEPDDPDDPDDEEETPGFTLAILAISAIAAVLLYRKKTLEE